MLGGVSLALNSSVPLRTKMGLIRPVILTQNMSQNTWETLTCFTCRCATQPCPRARVL